MLPSTGYTEIVAVGVLLLDAARQRLGHRFGGTGGGKAAHAKRHPGLNQAGRFIRGHDTFTQRRAKNAIRWGGLGECGVHGGVSHRLGHC